MALLLCAVCLLAVLTAARAGTSWRSGAYLNHVAGVWATLADDLRHGTFYRPIVGELGYGGTRFMPLHFVLHALLYRLSGGLLLSGYAIALLAVTALLAGVFVLLRRIGVQTLLGVSCAALVMAGASSQLALLTIRGDALAAALNVWGLALCAGGAVPRGRIRGAALLFTLAWAAKVTTVFGLLASFAMLLLSGRARQAWRLAALTLAGFGIVAAVTVAFSEGRALASMWACALAGATPASVLKSPLAVASSLFLRPVELVFFVIALAAVLASSREGYSRLPTLSFLATGAVTMLIFGSPGTTYNHLLDLHAAGVVMIGSWFVRKENHDGRLAAGALAAAALIALHPVTDHLRYRDAEDRRREYRETAALADTGEKPILAENPMVPLTAGRRPYMLDPFMFRTVTTRQPALGSALWEALRQRSFAAVVLEADPRTEQGRKYLRESHFGNGFVEELEANYRFACKVGRQLVYLPRER